MEDVVECAEKNKHNVEIKETKLKDIQTKLTKIEQLETRMNHADECKHTVGQQVTQLKTSTAELLTYLQKIDKESNRIDTINDILHVILSTFRFSKQYFKTAGNSILTNYSEYLHNGHDHYCCNLLPQKKKTSALGTFFSSAIFFVQFWQNRHTNIFKLQFFFLKKNLNFF